MRGVPGGHPGAVHHGDFGHLQNQPRHGAQGDDPVDRGRGSVQEAGSRDVCQPRRRRTDPAEKAPAILRDVYCQAYQRSGEAGHQPRGDSADDSQRTEGRD